MNKEKYGYIWNIAEIVLLFALCFGVMTFSCKIVGRMDWHALSSGDFLLKSEKTGSFFPFYDISVFNGADPFLHDSFLMAMLIAASESVENSQAAFITIATCAAMIGASGWFYAGLSEQRKTGGFFHGIVWILWNAGLILMEKDFSAYLAINVLPWLLVFMQERLRGEKKLPGVFVSWVIMLYLNPGVSVMVLVALIIDLFLYGLITGKWKKSLKLMAFLVVAGIVSICYSLPYFSNRTFFKASVSIPDILNSFQGGVTFGIGLLIIIIIGIAGGPKESIPGSLSALIVLLLSAISLAYPVADAQGIAAVITEISLALTMISFMQWQKSRKEVKALISILFCVDIILPQEMNIYHLIRGDLETKTFARDKTVGLATEETNQRLLVIEGDQPDAYLHWQLRNTNETAGEEVEQSELKDQIQLLNTAVNDGSYGYLFTRAKLLGDDTILIRKSQIHEYRIHLNTSQKINEEAQRNGYHLERENKEWMLFHLDQSGAWGTVTKWNSIAIGTSANAIALNFEDIRETSDPDLNHYTYNDLSSFHTIYLSGFTYTDQDIAEKLILKLSRSGVRIVILADGIPYSKENRMKEFLGVSCNAISFENGYPSLHTKTYGTLDTDLYPQGYQNWHTYYLNGLDQVAGRIEDNDASLAFWGTKDNDNLVFLGLNLPYYYQLTNDHSAERILSNALDTDSGLVPKIQIVPLKISQKGNRLKIVSGQNHVCTSLADPDSFHSDRHTEDLNGLLVVNKGTTDIRIRRTNEEILLVISMGFLVICILWMIHDRKNMISDDESMLKADS